METNPNEKETMKAQTTDKQDDFESLWIDLGGEG